MYAVYAMLGLMFLTWGIAVWASSQEPADRATEEGGRRELKKAA